MSAFVCSTDHINAMVSFVATRKIGASIRTTEKAYNLREPEAYREVAAILYLMNHRAVLQRYGDKAEEDVVAFPEWRITSTKFSPVQIIKLCHCYSYQACEANDFEGSEAHRIVSAIEHIAARELPGYADAKWGM